MLRREGGAACGGRERTLVLKIADLKADLKASTELVGFMDEDGEGVDDENTDKLRSLKKEIADHEAELQE